MSPAKQIFYCFGCTEGGDVIKFVSLHEGVKFPEAVKILAEKLGMDLDIELSSNTLRPPVKLAGKKVGQVILDEIDPTGFKAEGELACKRLATGSWCFGLGEMMTKKGWHRSTIEQMAKDGHLGMDKDGKMIYVYPKGLKCRGDYKSSHRDFWVYGKAKDNLWRCEKIEQELVQRVWVTEGESDLISLKNCRPEGVTDAYIAIPGSSSANISPVLAHKIGCDRRVFLLFDPDKAGEKATEKMFAILKEEAEGCEIYAINWLMVNLQFNDSFEDLGDLLAKHNEISIDKFAKHL